MNVFKIGDHVEFKQDEQTQCGVITEFMYPVNPLDDSVAIVTKVDGSKCKITNKDLTLVDDSKNHVDKFIKLTPDKYREICSHAVYDFVRNNSINEKYNIEIEDTELAMILLTFSAMIHVRLFENEVKDD